MLGTAPTGRRGTFKTQIRIEYEKGSAVLEYIWEGNQIAQLGMAEGDGGFSFSRNRGVHLLLMILGVG